jgi:hypothetical protein
MAKTRSILTALILAASSLMAPQIAHAAGPGFSDLSQDDFDKAIRELSANSSYHSVTGAGTLGSIFGFEVGLVGGLTNTPDINSYSKQVDASADISRLPHAALLLGASVPMGFTGELLYFPEVSISSVKYQQFGASVKWTATDLLMLPFNLAVRGFVTSNKMSFQQTLQNSSTGNVPVDTTVTQDNSQYGLQLLASPNLPFVEPYIGVGTIKANGKLAVSGATTGTIFNFTSAQSAESSPVTTQLLIGANVNLLIANFGVEWSRAFDRDSYNLKLGFRF